MRQKPQRRSMEGFWPKIVLKKWLNISNRDSDFSADEEIETESEIDNEEGCECGKEWNDARRRMNRLVSDVSTSTDSSFKRHQRRKSETLRVQYINKKELRICVGTWNVGGQLPTDETDIEGWLDIEEPADVYVLGLQEIVPLNAGNVLGAEDSSPIPRWESLIRGKLNGARQIKATFKCISEPPSPTRFKPADDAPLFEDEMLQSYDSDSGEEEDEVHPLDDQFNDDADIEAFDTLQRPSLARLLSDSERIGLSWLEKRLELENQMALLKTKSFKSMEPFRRRSFRSMLEESKDSSTSLAPELRKLQLISRRKRPAFVRIISKQMVGIFLSVWVRRGLRKHIQNVKVSTVGVGVMGYLGNKGSIAISMSIHQTLFCFICCHLSAGEKEGDELRRNADVREIHRRTIFNAVTKASFPKTILDHERIIWLGDLNYRIDLSYDGARDLISKQEWTKLSEMDQLKRGMREGQVFDGWLEGDLNFPPTYKYELNSTKYVGEDAKSSRRTPSWCDRILFLGKGMRLKRYRRSELSLSDHRPVSATFVSEVEVFCPRKLQRALTLTDAEVENSEMLISDV